MRRRGFLPGVAERRLLGRFYAADFIRYALDVVLPFQFVYLYLALDWSEWAALPFVFHSGVFLLLELPTGVLADRYGRKRLTLTGNAVTALALAAVPIATTLGGGAQLAALCAAYALMGLGGSLHSGSEEAWVVDNLLAARRPELLEVYFGRSWSFMSAGGVVAGVLAILLLFVLPVTRTLVDLLWLIASAALLIATAVLLNVSENAASDEVDGSASAMVNGSAREDVALRIESAIAPDVVGVRTAVRVIRDTAGLLAFFLGYTIASFSGGSADEAFDMALVVRGLDARAFALIGIASDVAGVIAPFAGLWLARRFGARRAMAALLVVPGVIATAMLTEPGIGVVVVIAVVLDLCDSAWDPVARGYLHREVPSRSRATVASAFEQASGFGEVVSLGLFSILIGEEGRALREATPDLVDAFSGGAAPPAPVPTGLFGLPVPDLAILLFLLSGLAAVPLLLRHRETHDRPEITRVANDAARDESA